MKSENCRACGSEKLVLIYDFGPQPLAGEFPTVANSEAAAKRYPLDLTQCEECGLLQVTNLPPIEEIFHEDYRYSSSTVPDLVRHFADYTRFIEDKFGTGSRIFEFGCNDGVLLAQLKDIGFDVVGIDASNNVASLARSKGLDVHTGFLDDAFVQSSGLAGSFDLVTCSNVFAHIHDIRSTIAAVRNLLKDGGQFIVEVHDGDILAKETQFDTIYHEHLTYFTEATLRSFVEREGFAFVECHRTPMHGGGLRFCCKRLDGVQALTDDTPVDLIDGQAFAATIAKCKTAIEKLHADFGPVYGYGAAGRSQMFVNMTDTASCFAAVFDDSQFRQGRYIVGTDVPIRPFDHKDMACCVVLAWNYAETIAQRIAPNCQTTVTVLPEYKEW